MRRPVECLVRRARVGVGAEIEARVTQGRQSEGVSGALRKDRSRHVAGLDEPVEGEEHRSAIANRRAVARVRRKRLSRGSLRLVPRGQIAGRARELDVGSRPFGGADEVLRLPLQTTAPERDVGVDPTEHRRVRRGRVDAREPGVECRSLACDGRVRRIPRQQRDSHLAPNRNGDHRDEDRDGTDPWNPGCDERDVHFSERSVACR